MKRVFTGERDDDTLVWILSFIVKLLFAHCTILSKSGG
jgi:hypothetical protein